MRRISMVVIAACSALPLVLSVATVGLLVSGYFANGEHEDQLGVVVAIGLIGVGISIITVIGARTNVSRRRDLSERERRRWLSGLGLVPWVALPAWWWRLMRPLSEDQREAPDAMPTLGPFTRPKVESLVKRTLGPRRWPRLLPALLALGLLVLAVYDLVGGAPLIGAALGAIALVILNAATVAERH